MVYTGTIEVGLRGYPYALPTYPLLTASGGMPPAFEQQDFWCTLRAATNVDGNNVPTSAASIMIFPQGIGETLYNASAPTGSALTDASNTGGRLMLFPNESVLGPDGAERPVWFFRRRKYPGIETAQWNSATLQTLGGVYFANSGQKPIAVNPFRFNPINSPRPPGYASHGHFFELTAGPSNINYLYFMGFAPFEEIIPLPVELLAPGSILAQYDIYGSPNFNMEYFLFIRETATPAKQLNIYYAQPGLGGSDLAAHYLVDDLFIDFPVLHDLWKNNNIQNQYYRVNIWPQGFTVLFRTNGTGPTGQDFEFAVCNKEMKSYALVKFNPKDAQAQEIMAGWDNLLGDIKLDKDGHYWFHNGSLANMYELATSFDVDPMSFARINGIQLPAVSLPCYATCGPVIVPGG